MQVWQTRVELSFELNRQYAKTKYIDGGGVCYSCRWSEPVAFGSCSYNLKRGVRELLLSFIFAFGVAPKIYATPPTAIYRQFVLMLSLAYLLM